ncbi:hypothetical protein LTR65_008489 [Meristemomyces frigidus]
MIHRAPTTPGLYAEIGQLTGVCFDAGLNVDPSKWDLFQSDRSRRKRLWWALYIHDKWSALGLGRPSYIHDDDCNVPLLSTDDIAISTVGGDPLPPTSARMFVAMAALTQILSMLLSHFYTLRAVNNLAQASVEDMSELGRYFEQLLSGFYTEHILPLTTVNDTLLDPTGLYRERRCGPCLKLTLIGTLFLSYHTVELVLYRALLRSMAPPACISIQFRTRAKHAVHSISQLLENLQVTRLRAFWWLPISRINFAIAGGFMFSMLLSSISAEDVDYWSAEITRYRRLLDMQSLTFDTAKYAAARMMLLATVIHSGRPESAGGSVDPKQAFCRDFGVELNTL